MFATEILLLVLSCGPDFMPALIFERDKALAGLVEAKFSDFAPKLHAAPKPEADAVLGARAYEKLLAHDDAAAVRIYTQQAALNPFSDASTSLLIVSRALVRNPERLQRALVEPKVEALISLFAYTRGGFGTLDKEIQAALRMLAAKPQNVAADVVAAALFRYGHLSEAAAALARPGGDLIVGLRPWVAAKLAIAKGKNADAIDALERAILLLPTHDLKIAASMDLGLLKLAAGDYSRALSLMLETGETQPWAGNALHWHDAAYVAERVIDTSALSDFVTKSPHAACGQHTEYTDRRCLSALLARRLMREGKLDAAAPFFEQSGLDQDTRDSRRIFDLSERLASLGAQPIARAELLFAQAALTRRRGIELYGTELAPDWALYNGSYEPQTEADVEAALSSRFVSNDERRRVMGTVAKPTQRYHYRAKAADLAEHAADLVPARSQAYGALLCSAIRFGGDRARLWTKYVKHGAAGIFYDDSCPQPEFARAQAQADADSLRALKRFYKWLPRVAASAAMALLALLLLKRRNDRRSRAAP